MCLFVCKLRIYEIVFCWVPTGLPKGLLTRSHHWFKKLGAEIGNEPLPEWPNSIDFIWQHHATMSWIMGGDELTQFEFPFIENRAGSITGCFQNANRASMLDEYWFHKSTKLLLSMTAWQFAEIDPLIKISPKQEVTSWQAGKVLTIEAPYKHAKHYSNVTWASWYLKSPGHLTVCLFRLTTTTKTNLCINGPHQWIPLTQVQLCHEIIMIDLYWTGIGMMLYVLAWCYE